MCKNPDSIKTRIETFFWCYDIFFVHPSKNPDSIKTRIETDYYKERMAKTTSVRTLIPLKQG